MLEMYDFPSQRAANDRFWQAIRANLGYGPDGLSRGADPWEIWRAPDLLFAQTCGMPYRTALHPFVTLIGTPDYGVPGCPPGHYRSVFVVRADSTATRVQDLAGAVFAYNDALSQSGWAAPMTHVGALGLTFGGFVRTGAHVASAHCVADGGADLAALDAVSWALLQRNDPTLGTRLRVLDSTDPTPGLPFVTAAGRDPAPLAQAVSAAIDALSDEDRAALRLTALVSIPAGHYHAVPNPPPPPTDKPRASESA